MAAISGAEIEELVLRFYQPGNVQEIKQIETHLRDLQRSPQGWEMGDYLLARDDSSLQFFGALTFQVKLNTSNSELDDAGLLQVGHRLIGWLVTSIKRGDASVTLRKLCSTIAYYCTLNREIQIETIIRRVTLSLAHGQAVEFSISELPDPSTAVENLKDAQLTTLLWFLTGLTEEVTKETASKDVQTLALMALRIEANLPDATKLLGHCFLITRVLEGSQQGYKLQIEALITLTAWIFHAQKSAWMTNPELIKPLQEITDAVLEWFESTELDEAADAIGDILYDFPSFFTAAQKTKISKIIVGPWAQESLQALLIEPTDELPRFVRLLLAFADQSLTQLVENPEDTLTQQIMGRHCFLLDCRSLLILLRCYAHSTTEPRLRCCG
jgi:hypothetical protein